jgi:DNA-binding MarR family transcriptional regulator/biotin operon repressor
MPEARSPVLTSAQAACLIALRDGKDLKTEIAIQAGLDLAGTTAALAALAELELVTQDLTRRWHPSRRGKACRFETVADPAPRKPGLPGPSGQRLLELLDRPMHGNELAEKLGVCHQRVRQLLIELSARGRVRFGDPSTPFWLVLRTEDKTPFLSRDEERVLSAIPQEYATNTTKIRLAARMPEAKVVPLIERLIASGLVEALHRFRSNLVYRVTSAGLQHPQRAPASRPAQAPRPPVESERVRKVLSLILDAGALRIRDVTDALGIARQSINALMQYLKRKHLVRKIGP